MVLVNGFPAILDPDGSWRVALRGGTPSATYVIKGDEWRYLDDGSDQGIAWRWPGYDDSPWSAGAGILGYGDTGEVTTPINPGGHFGFSKHITHYFRKSFQVRSPQEIVSATLSLLIDDGAAVYLNGVEIVRQNLAAPADSRTTADSEVEGDDEHAYFLHSINPALFVEGENVLAVEAHISDPHASPDLRFDLSLRAQLLTDPTPGLRRYPGTNRYSITAVDAAGNVLDEIVSNIFGTSTTSDLGGTLTTDTTLAAADGPYRISTNLIVPPGVTLTILPGTTVYFGANASLTVRGTLIAEGEPHARIRFSPPPGGTLVPDIHPSLPLAPPKWDGIQFVDSPNPENVIAYADFEHAQDSSGALGIRRSEIRVVGCSFALTHLRMIYLESSSVLIEGCEFADMFDADQRPAELGLDNVSEHIKGLGTIPAGGRFIIRGNSFGSNRGHNDVIDVDSGVRPNPIVQILDNTFAGAGDEMIDLGGEAYIAGNTFVNIAKDVDNTDLGYASAISTGDAAPGSTVVVARNFFYDVDHAINLKRGDVTIFENNTVVRVHPDFTDAGGNEVVSSAINLYVDEPSGSPSGGAYAANNLFVETPRAFGNADRPAGRSSQLEFHHNLYGTGIAEAEVGSRGLTAPQLGSANVHGWPGLADPEAGDFALAATSPARGAGNVGQDLGASASANLSIGGEPAGATSSTSASLKFGGPGMFAFRYRINGGIWSDPLPIGNGFEPGSETVRIGTVELSDLAPGEYVVEAIGQDFAGVWQDEATPTVSRSWTVDPLAGAVVLNEVFANGSEVNPDWIELHNSAGTAADISGHSIRDASPLSNPLVFPAGTMIPAGGFLRILADDGAAGEGLHAGFKLDSTNGDRVIYSDPGGNVQSIGFGRLLSDHSLARGPSGGWRLSIPTPDGENRSTPTGVPAHVRINEWLANADIVVDEDFAELYNPSPLPIDLGGLGLGDDPLLQEVYEIAPHTYIAGGGLLTFDLVGGDPTAATQLGFKLARDCEALALTDTDGSLIDFVLVTGHQPDVSSGMSWPERDGYQNFRLPTPGTFNGSEETFVMFPEEEIFAAGSVWNYDESGSVAGDWAELAFDDSAWESGPTQMGFGENDENTDLARGVITYYFRATVTPQAAENSVSHYRAEILRDDGAVLHINGVEAARQNMPTGPVTGTTLAIDSIGGSAENQFFSAEIPDGMIIPGTENILAVEVHQFNISSSDLSFDLRLFQQESAIVPRDPLFARSEALFEHLRITELMYHPPGNARAEFVELHNTSDTVTLDLEGLRLSDAIEFEFPPIDLPPQAYLLVVEDLDEFQASYGAGLPVAGTFSGRLANGDDRVRLVLPSPMRSQVLNFKYDDSWHPPSDGGGASMNIIDPLGERSRWDVSIGWVAQLPSPGTAPATLEFSAWAAQFAITDPAGDRNGDGITHLIEYALDLSPHAKPDRPNLLPAIDPESGRFAFT
ncbi:MAG: lamin tail domain-containing protein, partial [Verrucomicrobiales bacterium]